MRIVAKFQLTAPLGVELADQIGGVLDKWSSRKFSRNAGGDIVIRATGAGAAYDKSAESLQDRRRDTVAILEPVDGGTLQTSVDVVSGPDRTAFRCVLSVGSDAGIAPADVSLRAPRFIREIVALGTTWTIGVSGERVFPHCFPIDIDDLPDLEALMFASQRRLPLVIVSELNGECLAGDLHERLSQDLCGIAHTVRLSHEASWELTRSRGKEWSCYNGAVRLLWPVGKSSHDYRAHPLWTADYLLRGAETAVQARDRFRALLAGRIIEASTFVADDPAFRDFEAARAKNAAEQLRAAAAGDGDMQALADAYAAENDTLREEVDAQAREIELLRQNIEALNVALRSSPSVEANETREAPPQTVSEAVATARRELAGRVVIATETDGDVADLNPSAGPPDKILRYLRVLGELADALATGPIGNSVPIWLRERGVECSGDSETMRSSKEGKRFRTRPVDGEFVDCEFHAKPAEGVSPDMCARIYFAIAGSAPYVKVGYIGRHAV